MPTLVNWDLIREPINWIIVILMVMIASFALCLLMSPALDGT